MRSTRRKIAAVAAVGLVAAGGSAFTAANTVDATSAGTGSSVVTGYAVTDITYGLKTLSGTATDDEVDQVTFTLTSGGNGHATQARAKVTGAGSAATAVYAECIVDAAATTTLADADGNVWDCAVAGNVKAADITGVDVVATQ